VPLEMHASATMIGETLDHPRTTARKRVSSDGIQTVTSGTFPSFVLEAKGPIVVEFMSYGRSHCQALEPILQQVAEQVKSKERIFRVNTAVKQELADS
jgi:thioredoxin-like negative regulator of GroEL